MADLGKRSDFHTHSLHSDGVLLPSEAARYACVMGYKAFAITDHVDFSNVGSVVPKLALFARKHGPLLGIRFYPGVEVTHAHPDLIKDIAETAVGLGAKVIVCHGETPSEPVMKGTNRAALELKGLVHILAHPGLITEEDVELAKTNNIFLEISAKPAHKQTNRHVAELAMKIGAKMLVNTDAHVPESYIDQEKAYAIAMEAGMDERTAIATVRDNPEELIGILG